MIIDERKPKTRTLRGWAISVLQESGAITECETHGWMQDRADPHARERSRRHRSPASTGRRAFGASRRRDPRRVGFDRRRLPGVPAERGGVIRTSVAPVA
jgi:hypothetical protein